jgi:hypothetical protein
MAERLQVFAHRGSQGSRVAGATLTAR